MYKKQYESQSITRISDGASIPVDENNRDYKEYLEWCKEGNKPLEADPIIILVDELRKREYPKIETVIGALMDSGFIPFEKYPELQELQNQRLAIKEKYPK